MELVIIIFIILLLVMMVSELGAFLTTVWEEIVLHYF